MAGDLLMGWSGKAEDASMMKAIKTSGAEAVHPGYGFLSENPRFADAVEQAGIIFVGPRAETIHMMGRQSDGACGGDGRRGPSRSIASEIGYPVMIKASEGGGGRGIRVATDVASLEARCRRQWR
jgi:acetyl-CoA carboxylase biotin carboxylase subunit